MITRRQFMHRTALAGSAAALTSVAAAPLLPTRLQAEETYRGDGLPPASRAPITGRWRFPTAGSCRGKLSAA